MAEPFQPTGQPTRPDGAKPSRPVALDLPARFRDYDELQDVTAPRTRRGRYMNQSFISMIASAGLGSNLAPASTSGLGADEEPGERSRGDPAPADYGPLPLAGKLRMEQSVANMGRYTRSKDRMLQSSPGLQRFSKLQNRQRTPEDNMLTSQILTPPTNVRSPSGPSRMATSPLQAPDPLPSPGSQPELSDASGNLPSDESDQHEQAEDDHTEGLANSAEADITLSKRLATMFALKEPEAVIAEFRCCLLQDHSQDGYMYLLQRHICFYAYLPQRPNVVSKSGFLSKRGRQNPRYNRYWFVLKGDVLSYYTDRAQPYFPRNTIDLKSGVTISQDDDNQAGFSVTTPQATFRFKADSAQSAQEWIDRINRVAFRSHHTGSSVKICIPLKNVMDIEDFQMNDSASMLNLKVIDTDESFAVDEASLLVRSKYFFSFFGCDPETIKKLHEEIRTIGTSGLEKPKDGTELEDVSLDDPVKPQSALQHAADRSEDAVTERSGDITWSTSLSKHLFSSSASSSQPRIERPGLREQTSFSSVTSLYRASTDRLWQAANMAETLKSGSLRVGSRLANESKGYYDKVSTMWTGKKLHYDDNETPLYEQTSDHEGEKRDKRPGDRFRDHFALPASEKLQATYYTYLQRGVPTYGKLYVGSSKLCFRSLVPGTHTKMILPFRDIENVNQEKGFRFGHSGLVIVVRGHEELFFEFRQAVGRDDCTLTLLTILDSIRSMQDSRVLDDGEQNTVTAAKNEHDLLQKARLARRRSSVVTVDLDAMDILDTEAPIIFDDTFASILDFRPSEPLKITCLTIGSRGDVQPYIALCKGLLAEGHHATIATHAEFEPWIRSHGIDFKHVAGDPGAIMQLCVEHDMFTVSFFREAQKFRALLDEIYLSSWIACQGSDLIIESPSVMCGIHIAEALQVPYFRAFTMPWVRTRAFPHAFAVMSQKMGGSFNWYSYTAFEVAFWAGISNQINRFRVQILGLPKTSMTQMAADKVPFLYNFSSSVVPRPLDYGPQVHITGYWFLDEGTIYKPPADLLNFIKRAKADGKKIVYVGFGSVTCDRPEELTRAVCEAVLVADVRCILCKGWSDRLDKKDPSIPEIPLHDSIFQIKAAPHDWLFRQVDAAAHHGGAGTTGASLRAGIPTIVKPFFGDQHFFASRVQDLGVGLQINKINSVTFARGLFEVTHSERMIKRAKELGEQIRSESGVGTAIQMLYRDLEYARSLIKPLASKADMKEESEESWTLLSEESGTESPENAKKAKGDWDFESSLGQRRSLGADDSDITIGHAVREVEP